MDEGETSGDSAASTSTSSDENPKS
jgi:hypothetical protein